jgi:hypothetical protein
MIDTLHTILTNTNARKVRAVKARLAKNSSAGTPWFNEEK